MGAVLFAITKSPVSVFFMLMMPLMMVMGTVGFMAGGVFVQPAAPQQAVEFAEALLAAPAAVVVRPGPRHWQVFSDASIA